MLVIRVIDSKANIASTARRRGEVIFIGKYSDFLRFPQKITEKNNDMKQNPRFGLLI